MVCLLALAGCVASPRPTPAGERLLRHGQETGFRVAGPDSSPQSTVDTFKQDVDRLVSMRQQWVRYDVPSWRIAPKGSRSSVEWDRDALSRQAAAARYAHSRGLKVMLVTSGAPDWSQPLDDETYRGVSRVYWTGLRDALGAFVDTWQVFNEADTTHYRTFAHIEPNAAYLDSLRKSLATAHAVFGSGPLPRAVTTNVTGWPCDDRTERRWERYFGVLSPTLDVLSVDAYPATDMSLVDAVPARLDRLALRFGKQVYLAEFGLQTEEGTFSEEDQRRAYVHLLQAMARSRSAVLIAYELRDSTGSQTPAGFGVLDERGTPKSSYDAILTALSGS